MTKGGEREKMNRGNTIAKIRREKKFVIVAIHLLKYERNSEKLNMGNSATWLLKFRNF